MKIEIRFDKNTPLHPEDNLQQTYGCRYYNPTICKYIELEGVCAFVRNDSVCAKPPKSWKKSYVILANTH
jgi:hypothetical protein